MVCDTTAERGRAAAYKQRSESWGFIRRSAFLDDRWLHCSALQLSIMYNNHLGSLPKLAPGLVQSIPLLAWNRGLKMAGERTVLTHRLTHWDHTDGTADSPSCPEIKECWCIDGRGTLPWCVSKTPTWTTSDPSVPHKGLCHIQGSCLIWKREVCLLQIPQNQVWRGI